MAINNQLNRGISNDFGGFKKIIMAKQEAGWSNRISVFFLKKHGYFNKDLSYKGGSISWSYNGGEKSSVGIAVKKDNWGTPQERVYINLHYTHTSNWDGEKSNMNFNVEFTTTPCNLGGGRRYWFICPLTKNGRYCGKRVGVIYAVGKWFGCRYCGDIAYASQMKGGKFRGSSVTCPDIDKLEQEIKRYYYNGQPTRKYKRLIKMNRKLEYDLMRIGGLLGK